MKRRYLILIAAAVSLAGCGTQENLSRFEPEDGKCLIFVGQEMEAVGGVDGYVGYTDEFGAPYGVTIYTNVRPGDVSYGYTYKGLDGLDFKSNWGAGDCHADAQFSSPALKDCHMAIGFELVNLEDKVASGEHDDYIIRFAEWLKKYSEKQIFLRIGYEFDGHGWNHYEPKAYVGAFRRIHDILDSLNVTNIAYVWQSAGNNYDIDDLMSYYPGDEYVDWFAYSQFKHGRFQMMIDLARKHGKPLFIAESTPVFKVEGVNVVRMDLSNPEDAQKAWNTWFAELFDTIEDNPDVIKAVSYINCNWLSQPMWMEEDDIFSRIDSRLQINKDIADKWKKKMAEPTYVSHPHDL